jgi:hypothetical protein
VPRAGRKAPEGDVPARGHQGGPPREGRRVEEVVPPASPDPTWRWREARLAPGFPVRACGGGCGGPPGSRWHNDPLHRHDGPEAVGAARRRSCWEGEPAPGTPGAVFPLASASHSRPLLADPTCPSLVDVKSRPGEVILPRVSDSRLALHSGSRHPGGAARASPCELKRATRPTGPGTPSRVSPLIEEISSGRGSRDPQ